MRAEGSQLRAGFGGEECACVRDRLFVYGSVCGFACLFVCVRVCVCVRMYVALCVRVCVSVRACPFVRVYVCVCVHACMHVCGSAFTVNPSSNPKSHRESGEAVFHRLLFHLEVPVSRFE